MEPNDPIGLAGMNVDELATIRTFPEVHVRRATTEAERQAIYRLRHEVYVRELGEFKDVADADQRMLSDASDDGAEHLYVTVHDTVVAALRYHLGADGSFTAEDERIYDLQRFRGLVDDARMAILSRFCALPEYRPLLVPIKLLVQSLPISRAPFVELLFCDCQPHLVNLYTRLGFRSFGRIFNDPVASILVPLVLLRGDVLASGKPEGQLLKSAHLAGDTAIALPDAESIALAARVRALLQDAPMHRVDGRDLSSDGVFFALQDLPGGRESLFDGLTRAEVESVLASSFQLELRAGDRVVRRGQLTRTLFVVLAGHLEVKEGDRHIATLERGDVFGEVAFLVPDQRRISDVYAMDEGTRVVGLGDKALFQLLDANPRAAALVLLNLGRSLGRKLIERSKLMSGPS